MHCSVVHVSCDVSSSSLFLKLFFKPITAWSLDCNKLSKLSIAGFAGHSIIQDCLTLGLRGIERSTSFQNCHLNGDLPWTLGNGSHLPFNGSHLHVFLTCPRLQARRMSPTEHRTCGEGRHTAVCLCHRVQVCVCGHTCKGNVAQRKT